MFWLVVYIMSYKNFSPHQIISSTKKPLNPPAFVRPKGPGRGPRHAPSSTGVVATRTLKNKAETQKGNVVCQRAFYLGSLLVLGSLLF